MAELFSFLFLVLCPPLFSFFLGGVVFFFSCTLLYSSLLSLLGLLLGLLVPNTCQCRRHWRRWLQQTS